MSVHHTNPDDVLPPVKWARLPSGVEITLLPLNDARHSLPSGEQLFARLNYDEALAVANRYDAELPQPDDIEELREHGLQLTPYLGTPTAETDIIHSERHDADIYRQLNALSWDGTTPVCGAGKHWIAGAPEAKSRLMGWDKDGAGPGKTWWQPPAVAHNRLHFDDGTTTILVRRPKAPSESTPEGSFTVIPASEAKVIATKPILKLGARGVFVSEWQHALIDAGYSLAPYGADGNFGRLTHERTKEYQRLHGLVADGVVGAKTWATVGKTPPGPTAARAVPAPSFPPLVGNDARAAVFGRFAYVPAPVAGNPEAIRITDGWDKRNIEPVKLELAGRERTVLFHRKAIPQLRALHEAWRKADLLHFILSFDGAWAPRFVRGSRATLSNHAYGSAFDINARWNPLGATPADWDEQGTVKPLVELAHEHGFYSGMFFKRIDAMHFEIAKLL